jgi:hypothetical protein
VHVFRSSDKGNTWSQLAPDPATGSGDDCLATDESNSLYWCNLGSATFSTFPLQADVLKDASNLPAVQAPETCATACSWVHGTGILGSTCGTSCSPLGVDRQWTAASLLGQTSTANAEVVLMYHDFGTASQIWVNVSTDGGATFGAPVEVLGNSTTPGAVVAQGFTLCNTVPAGVGIVPQKLPDGTANPHAGRIYVGWIAADVAQNLTGCNISMAESFHTAWLAWSDNGGSSWSAQGAIDIGIGHDASTPFAAFTLDNHGNPYIGYAAPAPLSTTVPPTGDNPATCSAESAAGTVQGDPSCDYHMWVVACQPGGSALSGVTCGDGAGLTIPGSASAAHEVDPGMTTAGTDVFPTIAAGDPGKVDVGWLNTNEIVPTDSAGKFLPGGCAGPGGANPSFYPPTCSWNLFAGQSLDLNLATVAGTWSTSQLSSVMHVGDICNLGIACGPTSNRDLLDFNQEAVDPTTGCAHIGYADEQLGKLRVANQVTGPAIIGTALCTALIASTPEAPWVAVLLPAGVVGAGLAGIVRRRRRRVGVAD